MSHSEADTALAFALCQTWVQVAGEMAAWRLPLQHSLSASLAFRCRLFPASQVPEEMLPPVPAPGRPLLVQGQTVHGASGSFREEGLSQAMAPVQGLSASLEQGAVGGCCWGAFEKEVSWLVRDIPQGPMVSCSSFGSEAQDRFSHLLPHK